MQGGEAVGAFGGQQRAVGLQVQHEAQLARPAGDSEEVAPGKDLPAGQGQAQRPGRGQLLQRVQPLGRAELRLGLGRVVAHDAVQVADVG